MVERYGWGWEAIHFSSSGKSAPSHLTIENPVMYPQADMNPPTHTYTHTHTHTHIYTYTQTHTPPFAPSPLKEKKMHKKLNLQFKYLYTYISYVTWKL